MNMAPNLDIQSGSMTDRDLEHLLGIMNAAAEVKRRSHFYLWTQGQLQSLIPHEVLFCVRAGNHARQATLDCFSISPIAEAELARLMEPDTGLVAKSVIAWAESGEKPLVVGRGHPETAVSRRLVASMAGHGLESLAVHGTPQAAGANATCFVLARPAQTLSARLPYFLELLLPQIHVAYLRICAQALDEQPEAPVPDRLITARELEILGWIRDGKSNLEIGSILGISPLTVKNHVQKLLRKLGVQNRAQAVAKGISLRLIRSDAG